MSAVLPDYVVGPLERRPAPIHAPRAGVAMRFPKRIDAV